MSDEMLQVRTVRHERHPDLRVALTRQGTGGLLGRAEASLRQNAKDNVVTNDAEAKSYLAFQRPPSV
jgi:hypothetical protein